MGLFFSLITVAAYSQTDEVWGIGAGAIYNFQTDGFGGEVRGYFPLSYRLAVSPQFFVFPVNIVHEFYLGLSAQYTVLFIKNWHLYGLAAGYYNDWYNYANFDSKIAKQNNFAGEVGGGIMRTYGCLRPYLEGRFDTKWKEARIHLGVLISFNDCFAPKVYCPAYP